ncbi:hypothetical protein QVD17_00369 [Tagetes erecta]|uniref:RRM domain-containing protein n=1 Tax=Tagetes erecta TaxID=13708 RepID=A0AAD8L8I1_TARER|nr:hypothetical protein QVD17_00369 [Tagetes erecta]
MSVPMAIALSGQPLLGHLVIVKPSEAEKNLVQFTATVGGVAGGKVFKSFGTVELVQLLTDETGNCKGFGFIQLNIAD